MIIRRTWSVRPEYQYASADGVHLTAEGYRLLGEKYAGIYTIG